MKAFGPGDCPLMKTGAVSPLEFGAPLCEQATKSARNGQTPAFAIPAPRASTEFGILSGKTQSLRKR